MSGKYLLDTNIVIALFNGDQIIPSKLDAAELVGISVTVIGELLYGAKKSKHVKDNINKISRFVSRCHVFSVDGDTAEEYSTIKAVLMKRGCPIPDNDVWIAAMVRFSNIRDVHSFPFLLERYGSLHGGIEILHSFMPTKFSGFPEPI